LNGRNRFAATPESPGDLAHGGRKMLWVSREVYDGIWVFAHAQGVTMREAADAIYKAKMRKLRAHILDVIDPEWRGRQPMRRSEEERVLRRAAAILRARGHELLGDVIESAGR
jgi:hypothetical protein